MRCYSATRHLPLTLPKGFGALVCLIAAAGFGGRAFAQVAIDDSYFTNEDAPHSEEAPGVLANDIVVLPGVAVLDTPAAHGTLTLATNGSFDYTPEPNYNGGDSFTYVVVAGDSASNIATVSITVNPINDAPVAANDSYTVSEDAILAIDAAGGLLTNDTDVDGDSLTTSITTNPANGSLTLEPDGSFTYTPNPDFNGTDTFTYAVNDGTVTSGTATVTITVSPVNDAPVADDDVYTVAANTTLTVDATSGVLDNDTDQEGDALTAVLAVPPANGSVTLAPDGSFTYTPNQGFNGTDSFTYRADDGAVEGNAATVEITVINSPPVAANDLYAVGEDTTLAVSAANGVLANDTDEEDDALTAVLVNSPTKGMLDLNDDGSFTYTPDTDFNGADSFTYRADDGISRSEPATVTITVKAVNDPPVAANDLYAIGEDTTLAVNAANGVVANDADVDDDALTAILVSSAEHGTLVLSPDGSFAYEPDEDFNGMDGFTYAANDGTDSGNTATVAITVTELNDRPRRIDDAPIVAPNATESLPYEFALAAFFVDVEGDPLYFAANSGPHPDGLPESGNLWVGLDGLLSGTPSRDDTSGEGPRHVTLRVSDDPLFLPDRTLTAEFDLTIQARDEVDVSLVISADPSPTPVDSPVDWEFTISNASRLVAADQVALSAEFSGVPFAFTDVGDCTVSGQTLNCAAGPIPPDGSVVVTVTGRATQAGDVLAMGQVESAFVGGLPSLDPDLGNNTAVTALSVGRSFSAGPAQTITGTGTMRGAASGDINGDGFVDLIVANGLGTGTRIYLSVPMDPDDPNGAEFRRLSTSPISLGDTNSDGQDALLVDLDGDGDLDLVVANGAPGDPQSNTVFRNEPVAGQAELIASGALGNETSYAAAAADLDGNGFPDLVFANSGSNDIFMNQGGVFTAVPPLDGADTRSVAIADFDGDLLPDIVFANAGGPNHAYRNLGGGNFSAVPIAVEPEPAVSVRAADFSGDGRPDLVFGRQTAAPGAAPSNTVYANTSLSGTISFAGPSASLGVSPTLEVVAADIGLDGTTDIVSLNATGTHQIFVGASNSTFTLHPEQFSSPAPTGSAVGDFNGDGRPDLAVVGPGGIRIFLNDGRGNLGRGDTEPPTIQLLGLASVALTVEDPYTDAGATATDATDGDVTSRIVVDNPVNTGVVGTHMVTYTVTDLSGNAAAPVTRTVIVQTRQVSGGGGGGSADSLLILLLALSAGGRLVAAPLVSLLKASGNRTAA